MDKVIDWCSRNYWTSFVILIGMMVAFTLLDIMMGGGF